MTVAYLLRVLERFWSFVDIRDGDECWPWLGPKMIRSPYGSVCIMIGNHETKARAHRFMWMVENLDKPVPDVVRHTCDNPSCVNPSHLVAGTQADNVRDSIERGRYSRGSAHPTSRLKEDQVIAIRNDARPHKEIAKDYNIAPHYVSALKRRIWWKHLP